MAISNVGKHSVRKGEVICEATLQWLRMQSVEKQVSRFLSLSHTEYCMSPTLCRLTRSSLGIAAQASRICTAPLSDRSGAYRHTTERTSNLH